MSTNHAAKTPPGDRTDPSPVPTAIDRWANEGGAIPPRYKRSPAKVRPESRRTIREQRDTAAGCHDRAAADLLQSVTMSTVNGRRTMELSAANWTARALMLERHEAAFEARKAAGGLWAKPA